MKNMDVLEPQKGEESSSLKGNIPVKENNPVRILTTTLQLRFLYFVFVLILLIAFGLVGIILCIMSICLGISLNYIHKRIIKPLIKSPTLPSTKTYIPTTVFQIEKPSLKNKPHIATSFFFFIVILTFIGSGLEGSSLANNRDNPDPFVFIFYNVLGLFLMVIVGIWLVDSIDFFLLCLPTNLKEKCKLTENYITNNKRQIYKSYCSSFVSIILVIQSVCYAYLPPRVIRFSLPLNNLPLCADGLKMGVITDLHLGPLSGVGESSSIVNMMNEENVDFVVLSGDIGDQHVNKYMYNKATELTKLNTNLVPENFDNGWPAVFWTSGNHENYGGIHDYRVMFQEIGIYSVENKMMKMVLPSCVDEGDNESRLEIAGIADFSGSRQSTLDRGDGTILPPDLELAMTNHSDSSATILLSHTPASGVLKDSADAGVGIVVSGHTHG